MDKVKLTLSFALIILTVLTIPTIIYYNTNEYKTENSNLKKQVKDLQEETDVLKTANLTYAFGVIEKPPVPPQASPHQYCLLSHLWITGWVFNSGGNMATNVRLIVLAFDETNNILMNTSVPIRFYANTATDDALMPKMPRWTSSVPLTEIENANLLSQENATVRFGIFHEGSFPNSTRYETKPVWENIQ